MHLTLLSLTAQRRSVLARSNMDVMRAFQVLVLLLLNSLYTHSQGCAPEFLKEPENVEVSIGESISFTCVVTHHHISQWFINETYPASSTLPHDSYVSWGSCINGDPEFCGGTLFIKHADLSFNGITVACQAVHDNCNGRNVSMSKSAVITVRELMSGESAEAPSSSILLVPSSSSVPPSLSSSPPSPPPPRKPPAGKSAEADKTTVKMTERLVQRVPLMAAAAGVCFVVGCVFGTLCTVTISRGTSRCRRRHKRRRRRRSEIQISPPIQSVADPNYAELTPVRVTSASSSVSSTSHSSSGIGSMAPTPSNTNSSSGATTSSGSSGPSLSVPEARIENDYTELGMPDTPQFPRSSPAGARAVTSTGASYSGAVYRESSLSVPPLPPRGGAQEEPSSCQTCIEVDLDELERAVLQQK